MLRWLEENPSKIPSPSRDELMAMLLRAWKSLTVNNERAFKSLFVTNALDGSEDYLVSDKLFGLIGASTVEYRRNLMKLKAPRNLQELARQLISP